MSVNIASALLKKRIKNRKLPGLNIPQTGMEEVDRALLQMREYLQMYEGDTNAPNERFVTLDELENAGLIGTATRQGFSSINKILGKQVDPVKASTATRKQILEITKTGAETLSELADSEVDGANPNDFFAYDGSNWINRGLFNADNIWTGINRFSKGYIEFQERQASDPPIAQTGRGYLWLEAGQTLYFRDEAGTDTDLTAGGGGGLTDVVDDLTPQLGGDLGSNGSDIIMADNDKVFFGTGSDASMYFDGTSMIIDGVNDVSNLLFQNFASHRFYDVLGTDYLYIEHDGTDAYIGGVNSADLVLQFFTGLTATSLTTATLGTHVYDSDQTVGAGQDNYVMTYDDALGTIQLEAAAGGSNATPLDIIGDINLATPPVAAAFTAQLRFMDNDETDVAAEIGFDGDGAGVVQSLYYRNTVTNGMHIFENDNFSGTPTETLRLYGGRGSSAGQEAYAMANRLICNYIGTFTISDDDPPLMVTNGAGEDGQTSSFLGFWYNNIQAFTAGAAAGSSLSINAQGGDLNFGNFTGAGSNGDFIFGVDTLWHFRSHASGTYHSQRSSTNPSGGTVGGDCEIAIATHAQLPVALLGTRASDDVAYLKHFIHGQAWSIEAENSAGTARVLATLHPDTGVSFNIPDSATNAMRTATQANGLVEINTDGAGTWERVLTLSDLGGSGDVTKVGTPVNDQVGVWTGDGTIEGVSTFTYDGSVLNLNSVGGTVLVLQDNNSTGGAAAAVSMAFHDDAATVLAAIGQLPIVDAFSLSSVATMILSTTATNSYLQLSGDVGTRVTGGTYMRFYDSTDVEFMSFANNDTDLLVTATTTAAMRFSGTDLAFNDNDVLRMGTGDDFSMTFNGTNLVLNSNVGSFDIQLTDIDIDLNDNHLIEPVLNDYAVLSQSEVISANAATLTYTEGNAFELTLAAATGNVTVTLSGGPPSGTYGVMEVKILQDGTARTITWAGGTFVWLDDTAHVMNPTVTTGISIYVFETWDGGTTWYASGANYGP